MGNTEKLLNQIMELKSMSKSLQRQVKKCEKKEKIEKLKVKKTMEKEDLALGADFQSQFSIGWSSKIAVHAGLSKKMSEQITVQTSNTYQL
ncbi:hypothetical protein V6N13_071708 [Hibiscus sabdariffa]|uniref:Translocase of chloroplast 159/132 membrane anchor domain-containing protein n=1 Tax=Hibiscus sabdariffa TaxID=183260 RepID=A0ABR2TCR5_9ROSI